MKRKKSRLNFATEEDTANIIIRYNKNHYLDNSDIALIYTHFEGYYYGIEGVINTIVRAYGHFVECRYHCLRSDMIEAAASSVIFASRGVYEPALMDGYKEYLKKGHFFRPDYLYEIELFDERDRDKPYRPYWEVSVSECITHSNDFTFSFKRPIREWAKYNNITVALRCLLSDVAQRWYICDRQDASPTLTDSIHFNEVSLQILKDLYDNLGPCPCDTCIVKPCCIQTTQPGYYTKSERRIRGKCRDKTDYENRIEPYLFGMLSYDTDLQRLLRKGDHER